jgi:hypothetical protein
MKKGRIALALALVAAAFLYDYLPSKKPSLPTTNYSKYLNLTKPSDSVLEELKDLKDIVSGPNEVIDRELIAVFNNEMGKRIEKYDNVNTLTFENYYYDAGKMYFEGRIAKKYNGLSDKVYKVILSTLGDNESYIKNEESKNLSEKMKGIAWVLLN